MEKRMIISTLLAFVWSTPLQSRWIAFKNNATAPISIIFTTHDKKLIRRRAETKTVDINPSDHVLVEVFTSKPGKGDDYLESLSVTWKNGSQANDTKMNLAQLNSFIRSRSDTAAQEDPENNAIKIHYDFERKPAVGRRFVKDPGRDFFQVSTSAQYTPEQKRQFKKAGKRSGKLFKEHFLRMKKRN